MRSLYQPKTQVVVENVRMEPLTRFWWGLSRPALLVWRAWSSPGARRTWLLTVGLQAAVTVGVSSGLLLRDLGTPLPAVSEEADAGEPVATPVPLWRQRAALWVSSLVVVQTVVLALSRDFQDRLARDLSLLVGLEPEDRPTRFRPRIDLKWLWRKLRRRIRGALATAGGVVALGPLIVLGEFCMDLGDRVSGAVVTVVSAYWWTVFTAARSARAWEGEDDVTPGTPMRVLAGIYRRIPLAGWFGKLLERTTRSMAAPSRAVERDPWAFAGLSLARLVATVPVVRIALRAAIVVAAAELLEHTRPEVLLKVPSAEESPPT